MDNSRSTDRDLWAVAVEEVLPWAGPRTSGRPWSRHPCRGRGGRGPSAPRHSDPPSLEMWGELLFRPSSLTTPPDSRDMRSPPVRVAARSWPRRKGLPEYTGQSTLCCTCSWRHLLPKRCVPGTRGTALVSQMFDAGQYGPECPSGNILSVWNWL